MVRRWDFTSNDQPSHITSLTLPPSSLPLGPARFISCCSVTLLAAGALVEAGGHMRASELKLHGDQEDEEDGDEAPTSPVGNGSGAVSEAVTGRRSVKHKLHTSSSHTKHHKSLSTSTLSSPSPPTALTPSSSTSSLVHQLAGHLSELTQHSQSTISTLRSTSASSSLLPTFQYELDAYQATFLSAAASLTTPIRTVSSHYSDRLEGAADECRSLSYRVSNSLSQLSTSAAGSASERIHSVYSAYLSLQVEYDNCLLLVATATRLRALLDRLQPVKQHIKEQSWLDALNALDEVRNGSEQLLSFDPHMATSAVYRRLLVIPHPHKANESHTERVMT